MGQRDEQKQSGSVASRSVLVIGFGNDLRGDDAAGLRVAEIVEGWGLPHVTVLVRHQLTPELADPVSRSQALILVDASYGASLKAAQVTHLEPAPSAQYLAHVDDPGALLGMAQQLFGHAPRAWCVHIPAENFDLGAPLSALTRQGIATAVEEIKLLLEQLPVATPVKG